MSKTPASATTDPIDRLEEKVKLLVQTITGLKRDHAQLVEAHQRTLADLETLKGRLQDAEGAGADAMALRKERDVIRTRVSEMLAQLDTLGL